MDLQKWLDRVNRIVARRLKLPSSAICRKIYVWIFIQFALATLQMPCATGKSTSALCFLWQLVVDMLQCIFFTFALFLVFFLSILVFCVCVCVWLISSLIVWMRKKNATLYFNLYHIEGIKKKNNTFRLNAIEFVCVSSTFRSISLQLKGDVRCNPHYLRPHLGIIHLKGRKKNETEWMKMNETPTCMHCNRRVSQYPIPWY